MTKNTRNRLLALGIVTVPLMLWAGFILFGVLTPPPPLPPTPEPNGYEDLIRAGGMVSSDSQNYDSASLVQLREMTATNAPALALARAGLSNECRVPVQFNPAFAASHLDDLTKLKRLTQAFVMEGRLAEMEGRPEAAARSYLDTIRLGTESPRGGVLIDQLVGIAISGIGISHLQSIVAQLDAKSCRQTTAALATLDAQAQTWEEIMQAETTWSRRTYTGLRYEIMRLMGGKSLKAALIKAKLKFDEEQLKSRQLILQLAARAFTLEKGRPPVNAADLVPDYLKTIPQDPFTRTNIVFPP